MNEFIGLCVHCGCVMTRDGPLEFEGVFCNHKLFDETEVIPSESVKKE